MKQKIKQTALDALGIIALAVLLMLGVRALALSANEHMLKEDAIRLEKRLAHLEKQNQLNGEQR